MIRIVSYNLHKGFSASGRALVAEPIRAAIHGLNPDIAFFQEIVGQNDMHGKKFPTWPKVPQHDYLKSDHLQHHCYGKNVVYPEGHHGNAILSRVPVVNEENVDITYHRFGKRGFLYAQFCFPNIEGHLHAICVHLGLLENERLAQAKAICDFVNKRLPKTAPVLIVGDFNDWRQRVTKIMEKELQAKEAFLEHYGSHVRSFPAWLPFSRLDRVYYRNLALKSCERPTGAPWTRLSDHLPLVADFDFI